MEFIINNLMKMAFILVLFLFVATANAQLIRTFGIHAAFANANVNTDILSDQFKSRPGYNLGVAAEWMNYDYFSLNSELNYCQKGFREETMETNDMGEVVQTVEATSKVDYISIPILAKFRYPDLSVNPFISVGPRFDFLVAKKPGTFNFSQTAIESDFVNGYSKFAFGASFAAGIEIPDVLPVIIKTEIRYNIDFTDSLPDNDYMAMNNESFDLWLGILF